MSVYYFYWITEGKKQEKQLQSVIVPVRGEGSTKSWQLFKFKAQHGEYNILNIAWDPAEKPSRRETVRRRDSIETWGEIGGERVRGFGG